MKKPSKIQISGNNLNKLEVILDRYNTTMGCTSDCAKDELDEWDEYAYSLWCKISGIQPN